MKLANLTQKELISKIEELEKKISEKKENPEVTFEGDAVGSAHVSKKKTVVNNLLKESESKLREAQEIAHIGHWNLDIINNELKWSDEIYRIFGMDPDKFEASYENFIKAIHPDDREFVSRSYAESLENKTKYDITHRIVLAKGGTRFVREQCRTSYDKLGNPIYSLGTVQDITELKLAEQELLRSEKRFRRLFEDLGDAVYVTKIGGTNKGQILEVNSAAIQQTGYTKNELLKMNIINDISIIGSGKITTDEWEEKLNLGELVTTTEKKRRKDGTEYWTEVIVTSIDFKGERASLSINHDITNHKMAEEELKKSEKNLRLIYDTAGDVLFQLKVEPNERYRFLTANNAFLTTTGLTKEQIVGKTIDSIIPEPSLTLVLRKYREAIRKKTIIRWEEITEYPTGLKVGDVAVSPAFDEDGICTHLIGSVHDITDRKKAENTLRESEEEIRKLNEELEDKVKKRTEELTQEKYFSDVVINSLPGIFSLIGTDGSHIRWNKNHEEVTGFSVEEYQQMNAIEFFHKSDSGNVLKTMSQIFEKGKGDVEATILTKSGKLIPYYFTGMCININDKKYIAGMAIDITKRKNAENELHKKTEDLEAFNNVMIEREIRIIEMKEEVNKLSEQIGIEPPYPPVWKTGE